MPILRADALVYPRELEAIDKTLYQPKESELVMRGVFSVAPGYPAWAESIGYDRMSRTGSARILNLLGSNIPLVDADMSRATQLVHSIVSGWRLRAREVELHRAVGRDIDTVKAAVCRRVMAEEENSLILNGDTAFGIEGMFTLTGRQETSATQQNGDSNTYWASCDEDEGWVIFAHVKQGRALLATRDGYDGQALIVSKTNAEHLTKSMNDKHEVTVLERIKNLGWFTAGIFSSSTMPDTKFAVVDNRSEQIQLGITQDLTRLDPWQDSPFSQVIAVEERYGGLVARFPLSVAVITGIAS